MLFVQFASWQRCSIAALAKIGSEGVTVYINPVSWSMDISTLMKEFTAVLARVTALGFCKQTSRERRNDSAANTWSSLIALYSPNCLPPRSFNLANLLMSWALSFAYAYQRGL